ncbi:hypothetical protein SLEP1_g12111 [Rubroshorea leprosula]|nr:hypothetical protein SLEP1_g12111 [Rubroshorea leprosula]
MGFGALRTVVRSLSRTVLSRTSATCSATSFLSSTPFPTSNFRSAFAPAAHGQSPLIPVCSPFHSLTDTRYPKRRPQDKPRRKRTSLRPPGPYAWVQYVPGQPILPNNPNEGSVKRRKEKKRMRQHRAFVLGEAKKRKALVQEAKRKKKIKQVERKMAAVARERAWAERLAELQSLEEEKEKTMA